MRLLHFTPSGRAAGGMERYVGLVLAAPSDIDQILVLHSGETCDFASGRQVRSARWCADAAVDPQVDALSGIFDEFPGVALFHSVPHGQVVDLCARKGIPAWVFCHDVRWWCPASSRYHSRIGRECAIEARTLSCVPRYHLLGCGSLRPRPFLDGLRLASAGRHAMARARAVLVASGYMEREAGRHGADRSRIRRIHLPSVFADPAPEPAPAPDEAGALPVILFAGRVTPQKGYDVLLEAFARMTVRAQLIFAGTGIADRALAESVRSHPMRDRIRVEGHLDRGTLESVIRRASVVAVPSVWPEAFGLAGIEALSLGRPAIAFDVGGMADWAREDLGGMLLPKPDAGLLAEGLDGVLKDPSWRIRAREQGASWVRARHSVPAHMEELRSLHADRSAGIPG